MKRAILPLRLAVLYCFVVSVSSCSKGGGGDSPPPDACATKSITISSSITQTADGCSGTGAFTVAASGSTGFTFRMDNGSFQAATSFNNVTAGAHTITAKDNAGCTTTATVTMTTSNPGTLFSAVKAVIATNCAISGCHTGSAPTGGLNFSQDCTVVANSQKIKTRAVDNAGTALQMPLPPRAELSQADRDKITSWVSAGGGFAD